MFNREALELKQTGKGIEVVPSSILVAICHPCSEKIPIFMLIAGLYKMVFRKIQSPSFWPEELFWSPSVSVLSQPGSYPSGARLLKS